MKFKKIFSMVLCLSMVLGTVSFNVFAEETSVAKVGNIEYTKLADAIMNANGDVITLVDNTTEDIQLENVNVHINLGGYTLTGKILPSTGNITIENGSIKNTNTNNSAIEINSGSLKLTNVNIESARHAVRIDGAVIATIDGGTYKTIVVEAGKTQHAINVSGNADVTINGGTFTGPKGTTADSGAAVNAQADATVKINDGMFTGGKANTLVAKGTINIYGGTFDQDPSAYLADGYAALPDLNGNYVVGETPTATVNNLGAMTIPAGYYIYNGSNLSTSTEDMPLNFVMQFVADQDADDMTTSPFSKWYADFVITFDGIEGDSFDSTGCYLAGYYGSTESWDGMWVKIPVDGLLDTIEEGTRYPVMMGAGMAQTYDYICSGVQAFSCAMFIPENILNANPDLEVKLELNVVDSSDNNGALAALQSGNNIYKASETVYTVDNFKGYVAKIGETGYTTLAEALKEAQTGDTVEIIADGTWTINELSFGDFTVKAVDNVNAVIKVPYSGSNNPWQNGANADIIFENITFNYINNSDYTGLQYNSIVYNDCTINGQMFLYARNGDTFNNCTFNQTDSNKYNVWTYGTKNAVFNLCTFNSAGKSVLIYNEGACATDATFEGCTFIASQEVEGKAAVEIDTSLMPEGADVVINKSTATGFASGSVSGNSLWNDKKDQTNLTVTVDDAKVWPITAEDEVTLFSQVAEYYDYMPLRHFSNNQKLYRLGLYSAAESSTYDNYGFEVTVDGQEAVMIDADKYGNKVNIRVKRNGVDVVDSYTADLFNYNGSNNVCIFGQTITFDASALGDNKVTYRPYVVIDGVTHWGYTFTASNIYTK